ncbi:hypothetical protein M407DRAFT_241778 [Tulasnella calospora MUT 4182]|uniref:Uncharacterized protein n=1 Tax=Tulasnella calospora MUT 4182 TaxID=1051891 RepID=A0A0C3LCB2_9AGAM|nr:hypothetical protein M407DRAFT_241778 [Tulasnella calospora MUT 4182]
MAPLPVRPEEQVPKNSKSAPALPLASTSSDLAALKAAHIDLSKLVPPPPSAAEADVVLQASYEFVKNARAAIAIERSNAVEKEREKMEGVRAKLEEVVEGLKGSDEVL